MKTGELPWNAARLRIQGDADAPHNEVVAAYRRTTFLDLRNRMMEDWADYCARPSSTGDTVVAFRAQS
jgi:hypothetical protein